MDATEDTLQSEYSEQQEEMTMENDANSSKEESEDSESDDEQDQQKLNDLEDKIKASPFQYDLYVELVRTLREQGELDKLRNARERMNTIFPLTQKLWLEWIDDEMKFSSEERAMICKLFDRAVNDYMAVGVWLEYVQYIIGDMAQEGGIEKIRQVFERAITAVGLHVIKGAMIWDAYREFENAILMGLQPGLGSVTTPVQQDQIQAQTKRVASLFRRQLAIPLIDMESTFSEYKDWCTDDFDSNIEQTYNKAKGTLAKLLPYENALVRHLESDPPHLEAYQRYITYELSQDVPARIQCIYDRAIEENCLVPQLWMQYGKYVDNKLRVGSIAVRLYERSVRNCPWSHDLWLGYARALERHGSDHDQIKGVFEQSLKAGLTQGPEYLLIWTGYCDYLRRRTCWEQDHDKELEELREVFERAIGHLSENFPQDGDPNCTLLQYSARIEAKFCQNMEKSRELWNQIMQQGFGNQASSWLEFFNLERSFGDHKHCRKVLQRAVNSVSDYPETVFETYVRYEREEGTLEQYDQAVSKCDSQLERVEERRLKATEKEINQTEQKKKQRSEKKSEKKAAKKTEKKQQNKPQGSQFETGRPDPAPLSAQQNKPQRGQQETGRPDSAPLSPQQNIASGEISDYGQKRKMEEGSPVRTDADGFKVPLSPGLKAKIPRLEGPAQPPPGSQHEESMEAPVYTRPSQAGGTAKSEPPPGYKPKSEPPPGYKPKSEPPPGYKPKQQGPSQVSAPESTEEELSLKPEAMDTSDPTTKTDHAHHECTVFVSNLNYQVKEYQLKDIFSKVGEVREVRLVKNIKGQSRGYAYIVFLDELLAQKALGWDRQEIDGRPMYVSSFKEKGVKSQSFKYSLGLEKSKLFVEGLPFTMTKEAVETLFKQHGPLKSVRLVTYRSGQSKGLAYVEFENEADAGQAVMKTDQIKVGENVITVAISNPPGRKAPLAQRESTTFTPTLGSGKRETLQRGKARTQVSLVPRSIQRAPPAGQKPRPKTTESKSAESLSSDIIELADTSVVMEPQEKKTNADFRNMLLGKR